MRRPFGSAPCLLAVLALAGCAATGATGLAAATFKVREPGK